MRGYKVLTRKRRSCLTALKRGGRYYPVGESVKPQNSQGPLCVFRDFENAAWFASTTWEAKLMVECEYKPSRVKAIWFNRFSRRSLSDLPNGTALATTVTCLE